MGLLRMAALSALGYAGYKYLLKDKNPHNAAFAADQSEGDNFAQVRDAGQDAMRDKSSKWTETDQELDESFPASDPPANY